MFPVPFVAGFAFVAEAILAFDVRRCKLMPCYPGQSGATRADQVRCSKTNRCGNPSASDVDGGAGDSGGGGAGRVGPRVPGPAPSIVAGTGRERR